MSDLYSPLIKIELEEACKLTSKAPLTSISWVLIPACIPELARPFQKVLAYNLYKLSDVLNV